MILNILKKVPWWGWIAIAVFIILIWQQMSGWTMSRKLYNMVLDNLRQDQSQVIKEKDAWIKTCEDEILRIQTEMDKIAKEKIIAQQDAANSKAEVVRLKGGINDLQYQIDHIVVSDDPDKLIIDLRKSFPSINRIKP